MTSFTRLLLLFATLAGCQPAQVLPVVDGVSPNWGYNAEETEVIITGDGFFASVGASDGAVERYDRDFIVALSGPQGEHRLGGVTQLSEARIAAVVPPGLASGWYAVSVLTPGQGRAVLSDAFEVTATKADSLGVEASSNSLSVSGLSLVRIKVLNPDGVVVQEPFPVDIQLRPTRTSGDRFSMESGNLSDVSIAADGLKMTGQIGPTGEAYFIVSSAVPDDMVVKAEVSIRDRAVISGEQIISFEAGDATGLSVALPDDLEDVSAGESIAVTLSLIDEGGNQVSGQPATVALTEGCVGDGWGEHVTFVDSVVVSVSPTGACDSNTIDAFGVVEGGSVSGQSRPFRVRPGPMAGLDVLASPAVAQAGVDDVVLFIQGQDEWGNFTEAPLSGLALFDDHGPVSESNGNGTFSCEALGEGTAQCTARLYMAAASRVIRVEDGSGLDGSANPIQVTPGPGDRVLVTLDSMEVVAGESFTAQVTVEDAFGNRLILGSGDLASIVFSDEYSVADCPLKGTDLLTRRYDFDCSVTVAGDDNELHVQVPTLGVIGHSVPFRVEPGSLASVVLTLDESVRVIGVEAGESVPLAAEGIDAFGNRVAGTWSFDLRNVAGGMDVEELTLVDGVAFAWVVFTRASDGDSIWAIEGASILGGSAAFDVRPAEVAGVSASVLKPWAFVGSPYEVSISLVDAFGNPIEDVEASYEIDPVGGLGVPVGGVIGGPSTVSIVFDEAGLGEELLVQVGEYSTSVSPLDVALECASEDREIEAVGVTDGRVCLGVDTSVSVEWDTEGLVHSALARDDLLVGRGDIDGADVPLAEAGGTTLEALLVADDACGEVVSLEIFAGVVGAPVGPIGLVATTDVLVAGASDSLGATDLRVDARDCSGDPAALSSVLVRTDRGHIVEDDGGPITATGEGLQLDLDDAGEAMVSVSMADAAGAGPALVVVGTSGGTSVGVAGVEVSGDSLPPRVLASTPSGSVSGFIDTVAILFSERMLWVEDMLPAGTYFDLTGPSGAAIDIASATWSDGVEVLTLTLVEPIDLADETLTIEVFDTLRDAAGNRLDGDADGEAAGDWIRTVGAVPDEVPDVTVCEVSTGWFRPDGDDGDGVNADHVWLSMEATGSSEWWQVDVLDASDGLISRHFKPRVRPLDGSFIFDGRDADGRVLPEGMVVLEAHAMDEYGNVGDGCRAAVVIEQVVSLR